STLLADENYVRDSIINPTAHIVKGYQPVMPAYAGQLSDDQINQLLAYIKSLSNRGATAPASVPTVAPTSAPTTGTTPLATSAPLTLPSPTPAGSAPSSGESGGPFDANLATKGEQLFTNLGCVACHQDNGLGLGPRLRGLYTHQVTLADGSTVIADEAYIQESILNSTAKVVKDYNPIMPAYKGQLKDDEVKQLIEYIKSLAE
ncbi:MAG: c-type cytochrome, partial [Oscillochloris sp.]|nr:c-type cytochrome [Oscillochloris sp.]